MAQKALVEEVKLLNKVKRRKGEKPVTDNQTVRLLLVCRNVPYMTGKKMRQGCVSNMKRRCFVH